MGVTTPAPPPAREGRAVLGCWGAGGVGISQVHYNLRGPQLYTRSVVE